MNDGSNGTINMIVREKVTQPLRINQKTKRDGKQKEIEVMQAVEHILGTFSFSTTNGEGLEMPYDDTLVVEAIIYNYKV